MCACSCGRAGRMGSASARLEGAMERVHRKSIWGDCGDDEPRGAASHARDEMLACPRLALSLSPYAPSSALSRTSVLSTNDSPLFLLRSQLDSDERSLSPRTNQSVVCTKDGILMYFRRLNERIRRLFLGFLLMTNGWDSCDGLFFQRT